jgi:hypothetical protein
MNFTGGKTFKTEHFPRSIRFLLFFALHLQPIISRKQEGAARSRWRGRKFILPAPTASHRPASPL